ncbi:MAG: hypothetical protein IJS03_05120 [Eubacterium sp.]|nr:hypothetical protein [Eubacterium sp.]
MNRKTGSKLISLILSVLMVISGLPITVAYAEESEYTNLASAQAGVTLTSSGKDFEINENDVIEYDTANSVFTLDVALTYKGVNTVKSLTVNGDNVAYDSGSGSYPYTVAFSSTSETTNLNVVWTHEEEDPNNSSQTIDVDESETLTVKLTEDNVKKYTVTFACGETTTDIEYIPGEAYSEHKTEAESILTNDDEFTYSYGINWSDIAVDGTTITATKARNTFNLAGVDTEVKLINNADVPSTVTASISGVNSTATGSTPLTDGNAYINGNSTFDISVNNNLYKVESVTSNTDDAVSYNSSTGKASATFTAAPNKITVLVTIDKTKVELNTDSKKHFVGVDEELEISFSKTLPTAVKNGMKYYVNGEEVTVTNGKCTVNSATTSVKVEAKYKYDDSKELVLDKTLTFKEVGVDITASSTPKGDDGDLYYQNESITVKSDVAITITNAITSETVTGVENGGKMVYTLTNGKYTSTAFGDIDTIYVDNTAPAVTFTNEATATGTDNTAYTNFNTDDKKVKIHVTDNVTGVESVKVGNETVSLDASGNGSFVADQNKVYTVEVKDKVLGNTQSYTIDVKANDKTKPTITQVTVLPTYVNTTTQEIAFQITDAQSGLDPNSFAVTYTNPYASYTESYSYGYVVIKVCRNTDFTITISDNENNQANYTVTVNNFDRVAPGASLNNVDVYKDGSKSTIASAIDSLSKKLYGLFNNNSTDTSVDLSLAVNETEATNADIQSGLTTKAYYAVYTLTDADLDADKNVVVQSTVKDAYRDAFVAYIADSSSNPKNITEFDPTTETPNVSITYGRNVVFVYAQDNADNTLFAYSDGFTFDNGKPEISGYIGNLTKQYTITNDNTFVTFNGITSKPKDISVTLTDPAESGEFSSGIYSANIKVYEYDELIDDVDVTPSGETVDFSTVSFTNFKKSLGYYPSGSYKFVVTAYDMCANSKTFTFGYVDDQVAPSFSEFTYAGGTNWSESTALTVKVADKNPQNRSLSNLEGNVPFANLQDVTYKVITETEAADTAALEALADSEFIYTATKDATNSVFKLNEIANKLPDGSYTIYVAFRTKDINGNVTTTPMSVHIKKDTHTPTVTRFVVKNTGASTIAQVINRLTFGIFAKEELKVTAVVNDVATIPDADFAALLTTDGNQTSTVSVTDSKAYYKDKDGNAQSVATTKNSDGNFEFTLPLESTSRIYKDIHLTLKDALHSTQYDVNKNNTAISDVTGTGTGYESFELESNPATFAHSSADHSTEFKKYTLSDSSVIYNAGFADDITVTDSEAGIGKVKITANGKESDTLSYDATGKVASKKYTYTPQAGTVKQGTTSIITGAAMADSDNNAYSIKVEAVDNALNESDQTYSYTIDSLAPRVTPSTDGVRYQNNDVNISVDVDDAHFVDNGNIYKVVARYKYNDGSNNTITISGTETEKTDDNGVVLSRADNTVNLQFNDDGKYDFVDITVYDLVQNSTKVEKTDISESTFIIDTVLPSINQIVFENLELKDKFRALSKGVFTQDAVKVTVTLDNDMAAGFISEYTAPLVDSSAILHIIGADNYLDDQGEIDAIDFTVKEIKDGDNVTGWTLTAYLNLNTQGRLAVSYEDEAENELPVTKIGTTGIATNGVIYKVDDETEKEINSSFFISEADPASITIVKDTTNKEELVNEILANSSSETDSYIDDDNRMWFDRGVKLPIILQDKANGSNPVSGLHSVEILVNDEPYSGNAITSEKWERVETESGRVYYKYDFSDGILNKDEWTFYVDTTGLDSDENGAFTIKVKTIDFATNESEAEFTIYKDIEAPEITNFAFNPIYDTTGSKSTVRVIKDEEFADGKSDKYRYFFNDDTKVTVTAKDKNTSKKLNTGVDTITFYAVDYSDPDSPKIVKHETKTAKTNDKGEATASFVVKKNFKGQVYAYATDKVNNSNHNDLIEDHGSKVFEYEFDDGFPVLVSVPDATITETINHHRAEKDHIKYDIQTKTDKKDAKNQPLYSGNVKIKVTIKDLYSGVKEGMVTVKSSENRGKENSEYPFSVTNTGKVSGGWKVEEKDNNLATVISKVITVKRDSNNIYLTTTMTDYSQNSTKLKSDTFSIDKTNPTVKVSYDNNSASEGKYFKANRTATIKVTERNFDPSLFNVMKNGKRVDVSWSPKTYSKSTNKEGTVYTAKLPFTTDGDYTLSVNGKDRVGRKAGVTYTGVAPKAFTIDKTKPIVTVTYSSKATPKNGNYYAASRTAKIVVKEHNWNPKDFEFTLKTNGRASKPTLRWSNSGDTHTATYTCDSLTGLNFKLDFTCKDKASNKAVFRSTRRGNTEDYPEEEFYVDRTAPTVRYEFNGNDTGNDTTSTTNDSLASSVSLSDTYYDYVNISVVGAVHGVVEDQAKSSSTSYDIASIIENISTNDQLKDDFYTIQVAAYDKAGNNTEITRYFAVNRNGSIFTLNSDATELVNDKFTNDKERLTNLIIQERNVDPIKTGDSVLQLSMNGRVTTLTNKDYTVSYSGTRDGDGYYKATYKLNPDIFKEDALYKIIVTTKDAAGNTSSNADEKGKETGTKKLPILAFTFDTTLPVIDTNLDESKAGDKGLLSSTYSIAANKFKVTFKLVDDGAGIDLNSVSLNIGGKEVKLGDPDYEFEYDKKTGEYSFILRGTNENVIFNCVDKAGNAANQLLFKKINVYSNPFARFFNNTPLFLGTLIGLVIIAIAIILIVSKRRKKDDDEEVADETTKLDENED